MSDKSAEARRRGRVRQLFESRPPEERTETGILAFYGWLREHHVGLLPRAHDGDAYQALKVDLSGLYKPS
jgi:hypothetical protein